MSYLSRDDIRYLYQTQNQNEISNLIKEARKICDDIYGGNVFIRGLIEFSNFCRQGCKYCGINRNAKDVIRYRLTKEQILECCESGYQIGLRSFVLQGGEDTHFTKDLMGDIISQMRQKYPDCAITLSLGERSREDYEYFFSAGANRYLLRHETAGAEHYRFLHDGLELASRMKCLYELKEIGYQVGAGFMVGSPNQTIDTVLNDFEFLRDFQPQMVGIGPFMPSLNTEFKNYPAGKSDDVIKSLAITRILIENVLLPATTALVSLDPLGRKKAFSASANVVMPNLSPGDVRSFYSLYNNKLSIGSEAVESISLVKQEIEINGYIPSFTRGDHINFV